MNDTIVAPKPLAKEWVDLTRTIFETGWQSAEVAEFKLRIRPPLTQSQIVSNMTGWLATLGEWDGTDAKLIEHSTQLSEWFEMVSAPTGRVQS